MNPKTGAFTTYAGFRSSCGRDEGSLSTSKFKYPKAVAFNSSGDMFIADQSNYEIRIISVSGNVSTFAGNYLQASNVDGVGSSARFYLPSFLAFNSTGYLFVIQTEGYSNIRVVTPSAVVTTFAGPTSVLTGLVNGLGNSARFYLPTTLAFSPDGLIYVADMGNHVIRVITPSGVVSTFAGTGSAAFSEGALLSASFKEPNGITVDPSGNIIVADTGNQRIRFINVTSGNVSTLAGNQYNSPSLDGAALSACFKSPDPVLFGKDGELFIFDSGNSNFRVLSVTSYMTEAAATTT